MTKRALTSMKSKAQAGFSLVELMVVVTIIGVLAGIAMPKFQTFRARAAQTEGKSGLNGLYLAASSYQAAYNEFPNQDGGGSVPTTLSSFSSGSKPKYTYEYRSQAAANSAGWAAKAFSVNQLSNGAVDSLRINTNKWLCSTYDAVQNLPATEFTTGPSGTLPLHCPQTNTNANATALAYVAATDNP